MSALTSITIVNGAATTNSFVASSAVELNDVPGLFPRHVIIDISIASAGEGGNFEFYFEYSINNSTWFREGAQEALGAGSYDHPLVTRSFAWPASGTDRRSLQWATQHRYLRVQYRKTSTVAPSGSTTIVARGTAISST